MGGGFDDHSARRIAAAVLRVERTPLGRQAPRAGRGPRGGGGGGGTTAMIVRITAVHEDDEGTNDQGPYLSAIKQHLYYPGTRGPQVGDAYTSSDPQAIADALDAGVPSGTILFLFFQFGIDLGIGPYSVSGADPQWWIDLTPTNPTIPRIKYTVIRTTNDFTCYIWPLELLYEDDGAEFDVYPEPAVMEAILPSEPGGPWGALASYYAVDDYDLAVKQNLGWFARQQGGGGGPTPFEVLEQFNDYVRCIAWGDDPQNPAAEYYVAKPPELRHILANYREWTGLETVSPSTIEATYGPEGYERTARYSIDPPIYLYDNSDPQNVLRGTMLWAFPVGATGVQRPGEPDPIEITWLMSGIGARCWAMDAYI